MVLLEPRAVQWKIAHPAKSDCGLYFWLKQIALFGFCHILPRERGEASVLLLAKQLKGAQPSHRSKVETGEKNHKGIWAPSLGLLHAAACLPPPLPNPSSPASTDKAARSASAAHFKVLFTSLTFTHKASSCHLFTLCHWIAFPVWIKRIHVSVLSGEC